MWTGSATSSTTTSPPTRNRTCTRIGRTGRAGRSGDAISFVTPRERYFLKHIEKATRQPLTQMQLPTVDDVNSTRLARFDDQITEALGSERVGFFRDVVTHYMRAHDVPEVDVAAALAVVLQGDTPLLLEPEPVRAERSVRAERPVRPSRAGRGSSSDRPERRPRRGADVPMATYRISVGKRHKVEPRQIVGAIANEGGLSRGDFGHIQIRPDHSLVELPADLPATAWTALKDTRISGKLIELRPERGASGRGASGQGARSEAEDKPHKKPRHKCSSS